MYQPEEKKFTERGVGTFKLNVPRKYPGEETDNDNPKAHTPPRFIMRTLATYKVILNAPIFKGINIGDKEPTGKSITFLVMMEGRLVTHTIRVNTLLLTRPRSLEHKES